MRTNLRKWLSHRFQFARRCGRDLAVGTAILTGTMSFVGTTHAIEAITNGSFEDPSPVGWVGGFSVYNYTTQVYFEGPAPASAGVVHGWDPGLVAPQIATQTLNLTAGMAQIDAGTANYDFSAWLASWTGDGDYAVLDVEWFDSTGGNGSSLGMIGFDGNNEFDPNIVGSADAMGMADPGVAWTQDNWTFYQANGTIPVGTRSAVVTYAAGAGNDAYADLISLDLPFAATDPVLEAIINRDTRVIEIENNTGVAQDLKGYSIRSTDGTLIEENATFQADSDPNWIQFTAAGSRHDLSEGHLTTASLADGGTLGLADAWLEYYVDEDDLTFEYLDGAGELVEGTVSFTGNGGSSFLFGDLNFDGNVDGLDWNQYVAGLGDSFPGLSAAESYRNGDLTGDGVNDHADFVAFGDAYDAVNGAGAFARLVPEPAPIWGSIIWSLVVFCRFLRPSLNSEKKRIAS